jgi:hypothetical protein
MDFFNDKFINERSIDGFVYWNEPPHNLSHWFMKYWGGFR